MMPAVNGWHALCAALLFLVPQTSAAADDLSGAARELARRTASLAGGRGPVSLSFRNFSSLPDSEITRVRREFEGMFPAADTTPLLETRLTLSESVSDYLLVEEVHKGDETHVWMASWKRHDTTVPPTEFTLERKLMWEQDAPILDAAFLDGAMLILSPTGLTVYAQQDARWQPVENAPLSPSKPWPRDLRGRVRVRGNRIQAELPGLACEGSLPPAFSLDCRPSDEPWVLESGSHDLLLASFAASRNYFEGRVVLQNGSRRTVPPFYSAAATDQESAALWLLALVDGRTQLFNAAFEPVAGVSNWGSDIVGTSAKCGTGSQILATRPGDMNDPDAVQAFSIVNQAAVPLTQPVLFSGPVTALWPSGPESALAVTRDPESRKYQAYVLTLVCDR